MVEKSPYQQVSIGVPLVEYYRRLLIAIVNHSGGTLQVEGSSLLNVSPRDGLFMAFEKSGIAIWTRDAESNWEAHVGQPGSRDPESWIAQNRVSPEKKEVDVRQSSTMDDERTAEVEKSQARRKQLARLLDESERASTARVPWRGVKRSENAGEG